MGESYTVASGAAVHGGRYALPAWRRALAVGTWGTAGNNPATINPFSNATLNPLLGSNNTPWNGSTTMTGNRFANIFADWSGGAWHESLGQLYCTGGGHGDYAGNEIISINLLADSPAWELTMAPSGSAARTWAGWTGTAGILDDGQEVTCVYADGCPRAVHSYWNLSIDKNGMLWNGGGSKFKSGSLGVFAAKFDPLLKDYTNKGAINQLPYSTVNAWGLWCYDSLRHRLLRSATGIDSVRAFDIASLTWSASMVSGTSFNRGTYCAAIYDALRDIVVARNDNGVLEVIDFGHGSGSAAATISGSVPAGWLGRQGFAYYPPWDAYLIWIGTSSIYRLDPPPVGSASYTTGWTISEITPTAGSPTAAQSNGTFGRFFASARLKCCGVINSINEPMQVFALE